MKKRKWLVVFLALFFLIIGVFNFSVYHGSGIRNLYVRVVIDEDYLMQNPHWRISLPKIMDNVKEFYEKEFKISLLSAGAVAIKSQREEASMEEFALYDSDKNDIIIGFTGRNLADYYKTADAGSDNFIVLITNKYPPSGQAQLVKHEVAHLFSAFHSDGTIMDKWSENFAMSNEPALKNFDDFNKLIIKSNKYRNFAVRKFFYRILY